jgi:hypothetical protein
VRTLVRIRFVARTLVRIHHRTKVLTTNQYDCGHSRENDIIHYQIKCAEEHLTTISSKTRFFSWRVRSQTNLDIFKERELVAENCYCLYNLIEEQVFLKIAYRCNIYREFPKWDKL